MAKPFRLKDPSGINRILASLKDMAKENTACSTGGCGGNRLCPGIALLIAYLAGLGLTELTGSTVLGVVVGVPLCIALVLGLPRKRAATHEQTND